MQTLRRTSQRDYLLPVVWILPAMAVAQFCTDEESSVGLGHEPPIAQRVAIGVLAIAWLTLAVYSVITLALLDLCLSTAVIGFLGATVVGLDELVSSLSFFAMGLAGVGGLVMLAKGRVPISQHD